MDGDSLAYVTYTVKRGDTLWAIAKKHRYSISGIVKVNSKLIRDPDLIYPGWELMIPKN